MREFILRNHSVRVGFSGPLQHSVGGQSSTASVAILHTSAGRPPQDGLIGTESRIDMELQSQILSIHDNRESCR